MKATVLSTPVFQKLLRLDDPTCTDGHPTGPFVPGREGRMGSLLIFLPCSVNGALINQMSGRYGYSHVAIDCGEVDAPTGKPVMIEATLEGVHYSFQDVYGDRHFVRIPLAKAGIDISEFCSRIRARVGETYDIEEILTVGIFDDPTRQICSDLATVCLPEAVRADLARHHRAGLIHPLSAVLHGRRSGKSHLFVSPNGLAEYFGAPRGSQLSGPDQPCEPHLPDERTAPRRYSHYWALGVTAIACLALVLILKRTLL